MGLVRCVMPSFWRGGGRVDSGRIDYVRVNPAKRHTVAAVVSSGVSPFEFGVACEVFGIDRSELGVPWYRFFVCASEQGPVSTRSGFSIVTSHGLETLARADTIVVTPPG